MKIEPAIFLNPRWPQAEAQQLLQTVKDAEDQIGQKFIWFSTSGTTASSLSRLKWVAHTEETVLGSADRVNRQFNLKASDRWLKTIPGFHVGGYGILARSHLLGSAVVEMPALSPWNPQIFCKLISDENIQLTSVVPTQVYKIVQAGCLAPAHLKWVFVGGGALSDEVFLAAKKLNWPLVKTYGMTETASMIAYQDQDVAFYKPIGDVQFNLNAEQIKSEGRALLEVKTSSLLSYYTQLTTAGVQVWAPNKDPYFITEDFASGSSQQIQILGRTNDQIKVLGENVSMFALNQIWELIMQRSGLDPSSTIIVSRPSLSRDNDIILAYANGIDEPNMSLDTSVDDFKNKINSLVQNFNQAVLPFERIQVVKPVQKIPRNELGKVQILKLLEVISDQIP